MKSFFYCLIFMALSIGIMGCGDFLEESSQDEVRPSTVSDLEQLLLGEGYLRTDCIYPYLELLTDNVQNAYSVVYDWNRYLGKIVFQNKRMQCCT